MKILIAEDDFASRILLQRFLAPYGDSDVAVNGREAVGAFKEALESDTPYDLVCLDIMMPLMSGHETLKEIRASEEARGIGVPNGVKVIMTTALSDSQSVLEAFKEGCEAYVVKPLDRESLVRELKKLGFAPAAEASAAR